MTEEEAARIIADQNDIFRNTLGDHAIIKGRVVMTRSLADLGPVAHALMLKRLREEMEFTPDTDPYGEHNFGTFVLDLPGEPITIWWRIDLYDETFQWGSDDPANPARTRRVLTLMLPSEY